MFEKSRIPFKKMMLEGALPSGVKRRLYRRKGFRIAADVEFGPGAIIDADEVEIGPGASIGPGVVIRGRSIRIGKRVHIGALSFFEGRDIVIGDDTVLREQVFVGGPLFPDSLLEIGKRVRIFQLCFLNPSRPLRIGDETGIGGRSSIFTHGSWQSVLEGFPVSFEPVTIGRNVWLPWHVFILPGVEIGDNATIGGGAVVIRSVPAGALAAGVPARVRRTAEERAQTLEPDEQWSIARDMGEMFAACLRDQGLRLDVVADESRLELRFDHRGKSKRIVFARTADDIGDVEDVVVQLVGFPERGRCRFALLERRKGGPPDALADEFEDFVSRYGVRFAPEDDA